MSYNAQIMSMREISATFPVGCHPADSRGGDSLYCQEFFVAVLAFSAPGYGVTVIIGYCPADLATVTENLA